MSDNLLDGFNEPNDAGGLDLQRVWAIIARHKWWIIVTSIVLMIPASLYPFTLSDVYTATATVEVTRRPEVLDVGGNFVPEELGSPRRDPLAPLIEVAYSEGVLGRVVDRLGPQEPSGPSLIGQVRRFVERLELGARAPLSEAQQRVRRIQSLREAIQITSGNSTLSFTTSTSDPELAAFLVNAAADALVDHAKMRREEAAKDAMSFINTGIYEYREKIERTKRQMAELAAASGVTAETAEAKSLKIAELQRQIDSSQVELSAISQRIRDLQPRIESTPAGVSVAAAEVQQLREQYRQSVQDLAAARLKYTPSHPEVRRLEGVVTGLKERLGGDVYGPTPATPEEENEFRNAVATQNGLFARIAQLQKQLDAERSPDEAKSQALIQYQDLRGQLEGFEAELSELLARANKVRLESNSGYANIKLLDAAVPPAGPSGPPRGLFLFGGLGLAIALGFGVAFARDFLDQTIREPEEGAQLLGVPILGMIPKIHDGTPPERQSDGPPSSLSAESYRNLRTALLFSVGASNLGSLVITSARAGEGKTTVSCNLASSFAQAGRRVVLVDADMRLPRVHKVMGMAPSPGLADLIRGDISLDEGLRRPTDGLFDVVTAGRVPPNPSELLASSDFVLLLARLKAMYDLVLIDSPVLLGVSDSCIVGAQAEGVLMVHRPGSVEKRALLEIRQQLTRAGVHLVGITFNQVDRNDRHFYPAYMESPYVSKGKGVRIRHASGQRALRKGAR